jgi:hypothetical protein
MPLGDVAEEARLLTHGGQCGRRFERHFSSVRLETTDV